MYHAKAIGRNNFQFYTPDMNARARERLALENQLRRACSATSSSCTTSRSCSWPPRSWWGAKRCCAGRSPGRGLLRPAEFLPLMEDSSLIVPISQWALREACRQDQEWQDAGLAGGAGGGQPQRRPVQAQGLPGVGDNALALSGLDPRYLELELTESIVMGDAAATVSVLRSLKDLGVRISIDDFGTGYSSLSHLRRFPIDTLKIDQSFMSDLDAGEDDAAAITSAIISMAKSLRQRVIAEGVESREQVEFLQIRGCDAMQGYYYKPPLAADEFSPPALASRR